MTRHRQVREHGLLIREGDDTGLDRVALPAGTFDGLKRRLFDETTDADLGPFLNPARYQGREALRVQNYVGVLRCPDGTQVEILPKVAAVGGDLDVDRSRRLLAKMLGALPDLPAVVGHAAHHGAHALPLLEVFWRALLAAIHQLVLRGIRSDYRNEEAELLVKRGKILWTQQLRRNVRRPHGFFVAHDVFGPDRPENRVLKAALLRACREVGSRDALQLARMLLFAFDEVPPSQDVFADLGRCKADRNLAHYEVPLAWCRLLFAGRGPASFAGDLAAPSLLFPMERLFEAYVARCLIAQFPGWRIKRTPRHRWIERGDGEGPLCELRPDLLVFRPDLDRYLVADAKWKLLDPNRTKFGLSQADLYQMFAYAHRVLPADQAVRDLYLVYPRTPAFAAPLTTLALDERVTRLFVVPFDLETGTIHLPPEALAGSGPPLGAAEPVATGLFEPAQ